MSDALKPGQPVRNAKTERHGILVGQHPDRHNPGAWNVMADPAAAILDLWLAHHIEPVDVLPEWASWVIPPGHRALPEVDLGKVAAMVEAHRASSGRWEPSDPDFTPQPVRWHVIPEIEGHVVLPAPPEGADWRLVEHELHEWFIGDHDMGAPLSHGGHSGDRYRELNADPEPEPEEPIGPGDWIIGTDEYGETEPKFVERVVGESWTLHRHNGERWVHYGHRINSSHWRRCTSDEIPGNAGELYELLGIEDPR